MRCNINIRYKNIIRREIYDFLMSKPKYIENMKNTNKNMNLEIINEDHNCIAPFLLSHFQKNIIYVYVYLFIK